MRPINVLLLLSSKQLPHPNDEIDALVDEADKSGSGVTHFVTTRAVGGRLIPGKSVVALYGDRELNFDLLAQGAFVDFIPRYQSRWDAIIDRHPVYSDSEVPQTAIGMIGIEDLQVARERDLGVLDAVREDGTRVTTEAIRKLHADSEHDVFGTYASSIYYVTGADPGDPERIELLLAKKDELEKKTADFAARWRESEDIRTKIQDDISAADERFRPILKGLGDPSLGVSIAAAIGHRSDKGLLSMHRLAASITLSDGNLDLLRWLLDLREEMLTQPAELEREARKHLPDSLSAKVWRDMTSLENALWKAQVVVALPALDRIRLRYIDRYDFWEAPWVQCDSGKTIHDRQKLELGDLRDQVTEQGRDCERELRNFAWMRNQVCHLRLLEIEHLRRIDAFRI